MKPITNVATALGVIFFGLWLNTASAQTYRPHFIGFLNENSPISVAYGIDESGNAVGSSFYYGGGTDYGTRAVRWEFPNGPLVNLGILGGSNSAAYSINDEGVIAGESDIELGVTQAIRIVDDTIEDLSTGRNLLRSTARGVNSWGAIVGYGVFSEESRSELVRALWWSETTFLNLHNEFGFHPDSESWAFDCDSSENVVGTVRLLDSLRLLPSDGVAYWAKATLFGYDVTLIPMVEDFDFLSRAFGTCDEGFVAGYCSQDPEGTGFRRGFVWSSTTDALINIGVLSGHPTNGASLLYAVNNRGQAVGFDGFDMESSLGIYDPWRGHGLRSLSDLVDPSENLVILTAFDINGSGLIAAWGAWGPPNEPVGVGVVLVPCYADYNEDFVVDSQDYSDFYSDYTSQNIKADINYDGVVSSQDFATFLNYYNAGCD
ncbi:MAG: hypothetical protein AMXMBFR77_02020 [Phycisphaerales bacterium]|nr:hypothetical protein [Phycisphaerales bacterium]MDL1903897.1 hypothetical protein [Synechococcales cyanobacterium CNB]GIK18611.1 MAG: hypothetical protein BroJett004_07750 [Planctomycetota bacterium]